jgi:hypothetical protein
MRILLIFVKEDIPGMLTQLFLFGSMLTLFITAGVMEDIYLIIATGLFTMLYFEYLLKIAFDTDDLLEGLSRPPMR